MQKPMDLFKKHNINSIINARGAFTPLGVSRSDPWIAEQVGGALQHYVDISQLHDMAGAAFAQYAGSEAACFTHCASAAITVSIAAAISNGDEKWVAQLPDSAGLANRIVIASPHLVNYGHPIEQDIRLAGCQPVIAGDSAGCTIAQLKSNLAAKDVGALLYVESRLANPVQYSIDEAIALAHHFKVPVIIDAAAQDMRMQELARLPADMVIFSGQKYLCSPTCGIILGKEHWIKAIRAQEQGIGRAMKPTKEAIIGALAALELRRHKNMAQWGVEKKLQAEQFAKDLESIENITCTLEKDPSKGNFWRINAHISSNPGSLTARQIAEKLKSSSPPIHCHEAYLDQDILNFEILGLQTVETDQILETIKRIIT